jgi:hypothetical protein
MAALFVHVVKECCSGDLAMVCIREECLQMRHIGIEDLLRRMSPLEIFPGEVPGTACVSAVLVLPLSIKRF